MSFERRTPVRPQDPGFKAVEIYTKDGPARPFVLQPGECGIYFVVKSYHDGGVHLRPGQVLLPRWQNYGPRRQDRMLQHSLYPDIYAAIRGTLYGVLGYDHSQHAPRRAELDELVGMQDVGWGVLHFLHSVTRLGKAEANTLRKSFALLAQTLERGKAAEKQKARDQFLAAYPIRDSQGRPNLGVLRMRTASGIRALRRRLDTIRAIAPRLALQLTVLEQERSLMMRAANRIRRIIVEVEGNLGSRSLGRMAAERIVLAGETACRWLRVWHAAPFTTLRAHLEQRFLVAGIAHQSNDRTTLKTGWERLGRDVDRLLMRDRIEEVRRDLGLLAQGFLPQDVGDTMAQTLAGLKRQLTKVVACTPGDIEYQSVVLALHAVTRGEYDKAKAALETLAEALMPRQLLSAVA